jgi:hypothetical protein
MCVTVTVCMYTSISASSSQYGHINIKFMFPYTSSQNINIDSQNVVSKPKLDALFTDTEISHQLLQEMQYLSTLISKNVISHEKLKY